MPMPWIIVLFKLLKYMNKDSSPSSVIGDCNLGKKWEEHEILAFFEGTTVNRLQKL
jgi:hypothetical protein